ncbi:MAG: lipocalin family protein [Aridibacter sp.]
MSKQILLTILTFILFTVTVFGVPKSQTDDEKTQVKTVEYVDLNKYAGKWFEIARYPNKFQKKCVGEVTATYELKNKKEVMVINECLEKDGKTERAVGKATIKDEKSNAKLEVRFAPSWLSWLPQVWGKYWIIDLDKDYQYAAVGNPDRDYLWILSRTPKLDTATYQGILRRVEAMGFKPNKLIETPQDVEKIKGEVIMKPQG